MKVLFLGTGASFGVPAINCECEICINARKGNRNNRTRSSILISKNGRNILIDTSQDFRQQMLREQIRSLDAVLFTHEHADHILGLPDIRSYTREKTVNCYGSKETLDDIRNVFDYMVNPINKFSIPKIKLVEIHGNFNCKGLNIEEFTVDHFPKKASGYKIGKMAYISDVSHIDDEIKDKVKDLDLLILGVLSIKRYHSHLNLEEAISLANELKPKRTIFTHMSHQIDYYNVALPDSIDMGYDGMEVNV